MSRRVDSWKNAERHYCACCNVWMASDRISIQIHENGKKHREAMEASLHKRRDDKLKEEREKNAIEKSLKLMEEVAAKAHAADVRLGIFHSNASCPTVPLDANQMGDFAGSVNMTGGVNNKNNISKSEMKSWKDRKQKREDGTSQKDEEENVAETKRKKRRIMMEKYKNLEPNEGHYIIGKSTFLEGEIYISIMEEEMPVQIWIGSSTTTKEFRKSDDPKVQNLWKHGIILKVERTAEDMNMDEATCSISYLKDMKDEDETIEKRVTADRLRLLLGSDDLIPSTVEEARLSLLGGEETILQDRNDAKSSVINTPVAEIDENTGLSSWGTVSVRKVTVSQEIKEERARARAKRREEFNKEQMKQKEAQARKMEEDRYSNTHDSALGAYDVWSTTGGKGGYKGVQIHNDDGTSKNDGNAGDLKSLSRGKVDVKFKKKGMGGTDKKSMFKRAKKKQNRRKTFADDDDE